MCKRLVLFGVVLVLIASLLLSACSSAAVTSTPSPAKPAAPSPAASPKPSPAASPAATPAAGGIKLRAVSFLATNMSSVRFLGPFVERINKGSNGKLTIEWLGGPEVIPYPQGQVEAIKTGKVDILVFPHDNLVPSVPLILSEYTPVEERTNGIYAWADEKFRKGGNSHYLGRALSNAPTAIFTNFPVKSYKDLAGHQTGSLGYSIGLLKDLGTTPVNVPKDEWYSTVERKVVDAYVNLETSMVSYSLHKITKFKIDHTFLNQGQVGLFINQDKFNSLPPDMQKLIDETALKMEPEVMEFFTKELQKSRDTMKAAGVENVTFAPDDAKAYMNIINNALWANYNKAMTPDEMTKAKAMMMKK